MDDIRLIKAPIDLVCSLCTEDNYEKYKREFDKSSESDDDPVGHWIKNAKARGEAQAEEIVLTLLVELHRKVDAIERTLKNKDDEKIKLDSMLDVDSINYEYIQVVDEFFEPEKEYYVRVNMPTFPQRDIPMFLVARSTTLAYIKSIHDRDIKDWDNYVASRERVMIREMRS
jgi:hypothetical protein